MTKRGDEATPVGSAVEAAISAESDEDVKRVSSRPTLLLSYSPTLFPLWVPVAIVIVVLLALLPLVGSAYLVRLGFTLLLYVVLAASWNLLSGYTGYVSFGHAGFFGLGAYAAAILISRFRWEWQPAALVAGLVTLGIALLVGVPALRLKGPYFAIALLGLTETARIAMTIWSPVTRGGSGMFLPPRAEVGEDYLAMLLLAVFVIATTYLIATSRFGLRLIAIREDEVAAEVMGVNTTLVKSIAFGLSALFAGIAGGLYAWDTSFIEPTSVFNVRFTVYAIAMTMFGGSGTILGPVIGATVLTLVSEALWVQYPFLHTAIFGALIIVVLLFMPGGLIALLQRRGILPLSRRY